MSGDATRLQTMLADRVTDAPQQTALRHDGSQLSYQQLDIATKTVAAGLRGLGVAPGDRVAWLMPNCVEAVVVTLACVALVADADPSAESSIRDYVKRHLAEYKNPVRYLFLSELPRNATGKFDRRELAELASQRLSADN